MEKTRHLLLFYLAGIIAGSLDCFAQQYWIEHPSPTTKMLVCLWFSDSLNGWAAGDSAVIIHTSDGGQNWTVQNEGPTVFPIEDIHFPDANTGWAISNDYLVHGTTIYRTTNSGTNWIINYFPDTSFVFHTVYFLNAQTGFLGGIDINTNKSTVRKTTDAGASWQRCIVYTGAYCSSLPVLRFKFSDNLNGVAMGGFMEHGGTMWTTTDGGNTWIPPDSCISAEPLWDYYYIDQNRKLLTGGDVDFGGYNYVMLDGVHWTFIPYNILGIPHRIARRTVNEFWIATGYSGYFSYSTDTARTWTLWQIQDTLRVFDAAFVNERTGWGVGCKGNFCRGAIVKYNTSIIGLNNNQISLPSKLTLYQNYPNPFNPSTIIRFFLPIESDLNLSIFDLSGKLVRTLYDAKMEPGYHEQIFESHDLASGVYICSIVANGAADSKKIVFLK